MWLLQRKNLPKKHLLWLKIIGLCLSVHLIILFWVFCIYRENKYMHCFAVNKKIDYSIPILFNPQLRYSPPGTPSAVAKAMADKQKTAPKTAAKPIKNEPAKTTTIAVKPKKIAEPARKVAPVEPAKSAAAEKPPVKEKEIAAAKTVEKKIEKKETIPVPEKQKLESDSAKASDFAKATSDTSSDAAKKEVTPANAHVSNNFREVEAMRRGAQLQKELVQQWHPPIGVSPDCACDISFFVDKQGTIQNLKTVKGSGIMMFDISARQALFAMKMPQWTYGKPLIISFK
jgi:outer membrane biosynthesis protein TonB